MRFRFGSKDLERLVYEPGFCGGLPVEVVRAYRRRFQAIEAARDERDLRAMRGNRFKKMKGARAHQHSIRLNDQWRLVVEIEEGNPESVVALVAIEDYHR